MKAKHSVWKLKKVSFNIASKPEAYGHAVLPDMSLKIGQKLC